MSGLSGRKIRQYQVLEQIGRGGMAAVYRARDTSRDRIVALKLVAPHLSEDPNFERRFRREAEVLQRLKHPHIVPVLDYGEERGYAYLVMPFLQVGTLTDRMQAGLIGPWEGARLMRQIAEALQYAHDHDVIHRDVKPSNVLLDEQGNALLSDFGLARVREAHASITGSMLVGTPAYISPEQARGERATVRSDQYSLGVILFELTTGQLPFEAETPIAVALKHINEPVPTARSASPNVPEAVERVILKATAKDPDQRFDSVADLNQAFQQALSHSLDPDSSPPPVIELPEPVRPTAVLAEAQPEPSRLKRGLTRAAGLALAFFLVFPAFAAARLMGLAPGPQPAAPGLDPALLDGTIQAMSTELAGSQADLMRAEQVQTAVMSTLMAESAVGTATPGPSATSTAGGEPTEPPPSQEPIQLTPVSLSTGSPSATPTPTPSPTPSATSTGDTASSSDPSPVPLDTPTASPTATAAPSATPAPTDTPPPTPTTDACSPIAVGGFGSAGAEVSWDLSNAGSSGVEISGLSLDWPAANQELKRVKLDSSQIWNEGDTSPPTTTSSLKGNRSLPAGATKSLKFQFSSNASGSGYQLSIEFDNGCQRSADG